MMQFFSANCGLRTNHVLQKKMKEKKQKTSRSESKERKVQVRQAALNFDLRLLNQPITAHLSLLALHSS